MIQYCQQVQNRHSYFSLVIILFLQTFSFMFSVFLLKKKVGEKKINEIMSWSEDNYYYFFWFKLDNKKTPNSREVILGVVRLLQTNS